MVTEWKELKRKNKQSRKKHIKLVPAIPSIQVTIRNTCIAPSILSSFCLYICFFIIIIVKSYFISLQNAFKDDTIQTYPTLSISFSCQSCQYRLFVSLLLLFFSSTLFYYVHTQFIDRTKQILRRITCLITNFNSA